MIAYKAVYKDMSSSFGNHPVYELGQTYSFPAAQRGAAGFHAAEDPLFCLGFIPPDRGRYFKVDLQGDLDPSGCEGYDTATAATSITFLEELSVEQMLWASLQYRLAWAKKSPTQRNERTMQISSKKGQTLETGCHRAVAVANKEGCTAKAVSSDSLAIAEGAGTRAEANGHGRLAVAYGQEPELKISGGAWGLRIIPEAPAGQQVKTIH